MITLFVEESNLLTPNFYNDLISNLQFHQLTCPCGHSGGLSVHGYYNRSVKLPGGKTAFRICRVICEHCGHTHAILLSSMVPYSQISTSDHISIIKLRYSPDFKDIFIVEADGTLTPIRLLNKTENAFVKREKIHLCRGEE